MNNNFRLASSFVSDRGLSDKRPVNEDSFLEMRELGLFAVADGVGGAQAGDVASQMAMEILAEAFVNRPESADAEDVMRLALESANRAIHQMSSEIPQLSSMATTVAAIHVFGNIATIAHVGDSRVYRILPDGSLHRETDDHSVVEEEVRAGRMTPEQALVHPSRNVISRALGAEPTVDVELKTIMVEPGTMFLLCSDGITRHISDAELRELFDHEVEPDVLVQQMREICYSRGAEDNLTAVVVRIAGTLAEAEEAGEFGGHEFEEETIASTRSVPDDYSPGGSEGSYDAPTSLEEKDEVIEPTGDDQGVTALPTEEHANGRAPTEAIAAPQQDTRTPRPAEPPITAEASNYNFQTYEDDRPGVLSKVFSSLVFLILGAAVGAGAYYLWLQSNPAPQIPVLSETKSNNIPLTAFEEGRREVDRDPSRYLAANAASPQDAEDHYLLGRAQLLTGKYVEAARQFALAKERLAEVDPSNAKTLAAEIAMGQTIASNSEAADAFAKEILTPTQSPPASGIANTANSANSTNRVQ